jgi:hypothetical protein
LDILKPAKLIKKQQELDYWLRRSKMQVGLNYGEMTTGGAAVGFPAGYDRGSEGLRTPAFRRRNTTTTDGLLRELEVNHGHDPKTVRHECAEHCLGAQVPLDSFEHWKFFDDMDS